jgi:3-oxoacyl-[acyl-carrier protein] reductase
MLLINNAAIFATLQKRPFWEIPFDEWERVMHVNVSGVFLSVCAVLPVMRQQKWGRIINVSSDSVPRGAKLPPLCVVEICDHRHDQCHGTRARPDGITVNCIRPGGVATEVDRVVNPTVERRIAQLSEQCIPRGMVSSDLVGLAMFLSTSASDFITGQTIACDGGMTHSS